ncbi:MAG: hypothetical protein KBB37_02160 [Bacteroidia bacterium]|nr:hypothetical protein [Bacteroidia bacterium]MBP7260063.1 hypothetical protein [Bacteroidia bacterium]MBP9723639.1 hypothetical protein [Bacteroidia bacterium]
MSRKRQQLLSIETIQIKPDLILKLSEYDVILCKTFVKSNSEERNKSNEYYISHCSLRSFDRPHSLVKFQQLHHKLIFKPEISPSRYNLVDLVSVYSGVNKFSDNLLSIRGARADANIVLIDGIRAMEYENVFIPFDEVNPLKLKHINQVIL